jgi:16S rRNA processing protein RimM
VSAERKWVILGRVSGVFGVKGWLKVQSYTEPRDNIVGFGAWTLRLQGVDHDFEVEDGHSHAGSVVAKLQGIDDRDRARGQLYWADLEGLEVRTTTGIVLGKVDHLLATGGNDVLVLDSVPQRLIPFVVDAVVKEVDLEMGFIVVDWSPDY